MKFSRIAALPAATIQQAQPVVANPVPPSVRRGSRQFPDTFPLHLTASATVQSHSTAGVNAVALKNPLGQDMQILEIKWSLIQTATAQANLGGVIGCKLDLGKYPLTNGFVPVWSFGRPENIYAEIAGATSTVGDPGTPYFTVNEYSWKLPHPLYVPAGAAVVPTFEHRGLIKNDVTVRISYSARSFANSAPKPDKIALPWAAAWLSDTFDVDNAGTSQSTETDLVNPGDEPVILQRATGTVLLLDTTSNPYDVTEAMDTNSASVQAESVPNYLYNVRIVDSFGRPLIRTFTPFRLAFSGLTRSWEMPGAVMDPHSYWQAFIRKDAPPTTSSDVISSQAIISIVGHRVIVGGDL